MSVEAPERIRVAQDSDGFWTCREAVSGSQEYVRADKLEELAAALAEKDKALKLAEFMLTKDSLCEAERLEEGLAVIRRARNAGGKDAE